MSAADLPPLVRAVNSAIVACIEGATTDVELDELRSVLVATIELIDLVPKEGAANENAS